MTILPIHTYCIQLANRVVVVLSMILAVGYGVA